MPSRTTLLIAAALGSACLGASPVAAAPASSAELVANEIPLHVLGKGKSSFPADRASLTMNIKRSGPTASEARFNVSLFADQLVAELVRRGVPRSAITVGEGPSRVGFLGNEAFAAAMMPEGDSQAAAIKSKATKQASRSIEIVLDNLAHLPRVRQFLDEREALVLEGPTFELKDDRLARRAAINDAIQNARREADAYAAAANMRVTRMIDIQDQASQTSMYGEFDDTMRKMMSRSLQSNGTQIETRVAVSVGFALAPR